MKTTTKNIILSLILVALTIGLGYFTQQSDFEKILLFYVPFFAIYLFILKTTATQQALWFFVYTGIFLRFILIFSLFFKLIDLLLPLAI